MNSATATRLYSLSVDRTQAILIRPISSAPSLNASYEFERYIVDLFEEPVFRLLDWRSDKETAEKRRPQSCFFPDMEFETLSTQFKFAVKCIWQAHAENAITWSTPEQVQYYQQFQQERKLPVYIAIGIGGNVSAPEQLFIAPLHAIEENCIIPFTSLQAYRKPEKARFCTGISEERFKYR